MRIDADFYQAFRPGNIDLTTDQSHTASAHQLTLPDALTELDLLAPLPDPLALLGALDNMQSQETGIIDWGTQSLLSDSIEQGRRVPEQLALEDEELDLDLGDEPSVEIGRRARISEILDNRPEEFSKLEVDDLALDLGEDPVQMDLDDGAGFGAGGQSPQIQDDLQLDLGLDDTDATLRDIVHRRQRSESVLSELGAEEAQELERTFQLDQEPEDTTIYEAPQRVKRRKLIEEDADTEMHSRDIRDMQENREAILKPQSFLPRDPMLLALMNMSRNGAFVSDILRNGRAAGWAPQLQDILSVEVIKRSGDLKRKRDSGVSDMYLEEDQAQAAQAGLELPEDGDATIVGGQTSDNITSNEDAQDVSMLEQPANVRAPSLGLGLGDDGPGLATELNLDDTGIGGPDFDETAMPLLHPGETGPISQGTRHAVYLLRDELGPEPAADEMQDSPSQRSRTTQKTVIFQDLLPEASTSRADATKMFFEVLVLATKDAIRVEQTSTTESGRRSRDSTFELGAPIRLRAKRGLWGSWAEEQAGGQIEEQATESGEQPIAA